MDRRFFLLATAGFATTPGGVGGPVSQAPDLTPQAQMAAITARLGPWLASFRPKAIAAGVSAVTFDFAFQDLVIDQAVLQRDQNQPEFTKPIGDYVTRVVDGASPSLYREVTQGLGPFLKHLSRETGVAAEILVAVWGIESGYGRTTGDHDVISALATLAVSGRRLELAEQELISALTILDRGLASRAHLKGSWAGAMGQTQFLPSDYLTYGVDGDGDGRCDIWGSREDALASTANFLKRKGHWRPGGSWAREADLPANFDFSEADSDSHSLEAWLARGLRLATSQPVALSDVAEPVQLLAPAGWRGPAFFAFPNHQALRAYNNSTAYALAVGLLADALAGRPGVTRPWPKDPPLSLRDRIDAQRALTVLGFQTGLIDGVIGLATRRAAKAWQKARGLPADGYLTLDLIERLRGEAALSDAGLPTA